jgi:hypothetical protein
MNLGGVLANTKKDLDSLKPQFGGIGSVTFFLNLFNNSITPEQSYSIIKTRAITSGVAIYGHPDTYYGTSEYSDSKFTAFILGHSGAGLLGTSKLGGTLEEWSTKFVSQKDNEYIEHFNTNRFGD